MADTVLLDLDQHIAILRINRPDKLNALSSEVLNDIDEALDQIEAQDSLRVLIVTGEGKAFVAGADIRAMVGLPIDKAKAFAKLGHRVFARVEQLEIPSIAAVNGFALGGGCELALACDFIIASTNAKFGLPEVGLGIIPGFGGTQRLPRRVPVGIAREMIYSGRTIDALEALRIGLANSVVAPDELLKSARAIASEIASKAPIAISNAKGVIQQGLDTSLSIGCEVEVSAFARCFTTEDSAEGMHAFVEKRKATFRGH